MDPEGKMPDLVTAVLSFVLPLCITLFVLPRFSHIAAELGLVDMPSRRKVHRSPKPLVGGLAMSLGVAFGCLLLVPLNMVTSAHGGSLRGFYGASMLLVLIGFFDDFREVNHRLKFAAQIIAALLLVYFSHVSLTSFGDLLGIGSIDFPALGALMTVIGTVGVINAINMIDGVDGLAGGVSLAAFSSFSLLCALGGHATLMLLCLALCGAIIAFLRYNWYPSKLFMGDAGSLFLGLSASFVSIAVTQEDHSIVRPIAPLLVLAVPIADTLVVMTRRLMKGKSPFYPDKTHLHHVLLRYGFSKRQTVSIISAMSAAFSLLAIAGTMFKIPEHYLFAIFLLYFFSCFAFSFFTKRVILSNRLCRKAAKA
ncbi:MAG TPA: MraY family glycosyltransferase [Thermodesulfovibrionales bacterium]|nr:MraY family glycosyltransferase [Thermodesulfovibrionales bacterium]